MLFVDAVVVVVVVVFLAVAGRIRSTVGLPLTVPRVEGFSEFLQNALTGPEDTAVACTLDEVY